MEVLNLSLVLVLALVLGLFAPASPVTYIVFVKPGPDGSIKAPLFPHTKYAHYWGANVIKSRNSTFFDLVYNVGVPVGDVFLPWGVPLWFLGSIRYPNITSFTAELLVGLLGRQLINPYYGYGVNITWKHSPYGGVEYTVTNTSVKGIPMKDLCLEGSCLSK